MKDQLRHELGMLEQPVICVLFLDAQRLVMAPEQLFRGTVSHTSVYPREAIKDARAVNAAAAGEVICSTSPYPRLLRANRLYEAAGALRAKLR